MIEYNTIDVKYFDALDAVTECPKGILAKLVNTVLKSVPDDVNIKESNNSVVVERDNKQVHIAAWLVDLKEDLDNDVVYFRDFKYHQLDEAIVFGIWFTTNGKLDDSAGKDTNKLIAVGFKENDFSNVLTKLNSEAPKYAKDLSYEIEVFLTGKRNSITDAVENSLPDGSKTILKDENSLTAKVPVKDYIVTLKVNDHRVSARIPHKYTQAELAYGAMFDDTIRDMKFSSPEEVMAFDWDSLWEDLYKNRNGVKTYSGSLGS